MLMLFVDILGWWYSRGFSWAAHQLFVVSMEKILNFFSIAELLKTLFAPFRQDTMQVKNAPLTVKLQAFGGNIISRFFGFIIRSVLIIFGIVCLLINGVVGIFGIILWPLVPLTPLIFLISVAMKVGV